MDICWDTVNMGPKSRYGDGRGWICVVQACHELDSSSLTLCHEKGCLH